VTVSEAELDSEQEALDSIFQDTLFLVIVQSFAPVVAHVTVVVPPIFTRIGVALIIAVTAGSGGVLALHALELPLQSIVYDPEFVSPHELEEEVQPYVPALETQQVLFRVPAPQPLGRGVGATGTMGDTGTTQQVG
jgi:hypothetical protein